MKRLSFTQWLQIGGYVFISLVSICAAIRIEDLLLKFLLVISAVVSLILAISRLLASRKMSKRIKELEEKQLSVRVDDGMLVFEQGKKA